MNLQYRIDLLSRLGEYILADETPWQNAKEQAAIENGWFIPDFTSIASEQIARAFLDRDRLLAWADENNLADNPPVQPRKIGIIMAGNIPMAGFHDLLCVFITGHHAIMKPSSKDTVLIKHLVSKLLEWEPSLTSTLQFAEMLKGCDAYIATGSNNSSRYFDYYFAKYPNIIRRNRTSIAILSGKETAEELDLLADDVHLYFGLGCRNVTKLYVPEEYDFVPLLDHFKKYAYFIDHHKYKNNYDYNLALHLLNKKYYMTNGSILLIEDPAIFSPISQLNYQFYSSNDALSAMLPAAHELQCITGHGHTLFGSAQFPRLDDYADGVNTVSFLRQL